MYSDYVQGRLAHSYRAEKVALAQREQLLKHTVGNRPALRHRFLAWSGDRLIDFGRSLKGRYEPLTMPALADLAPDNGTKIET